MSKPAEFPIDTRQSNVVDTMRVILIVLVIYIHMLPSQNEAVSFHWDLKSIYTLVSELISHNVARIAVPAFFCISGFFFFRAMEDGTMTWGWLSGKLKSRCRSLVIPYIIWNAIFILVVLLKNKLVISFGGVEDDIYSYVQERDILNWFWTGPADFPLWYIRDLICVTLMAPLYYWAVKYLKWPFLILLAVVYFIPMNYVVPGLSQEAIVFFGVGAFMGITRVEWIKFFTRHRGGIYAVALIVLCLSLYANTSVYGIWLLKLFVPFGIVSLYLLVCSLPDSAIQKLARLAPSVFFIFAVHEIYVVPLFNGLFYKLFGTGLARWCLRYCFEPMLVFCICASLYFVLKKLFPSIMNLLCGGRITGAKK